MSAPSPAASGTSLLEPVDVRCEYLRDPLGIDVARPRLSWALRGGVRGERQSSYRVIVASTVERALAGSADLWDTGKVPDQSGDLGSVATLAVEYDGPALKSGQRAWWTVQVWNAAGEPAGTSAPASWEMGLLAESDWQAVWIGRDDPMPPKEPPPAGDRPGILRPWEELDLRPAAYLRRAFELPKPVASIRRARLWATARGVYELRLNGERAGDALLAPGWSDYRARLRYQTYDVGPLLRDGANTLGAILGTGWYAGHIGWLGQTAFYGPHPRLLAQLTIEFDDGTSVTIGTDDGWQATTGPILASDMLMGEVYDARQELPGWDRPGTASTTVGWEPVATEARDGTPLVADRAEPIRALIELTPVSITPREDGTSIVDLGQNMTGWARLRASGPAGTTIRLRFSEVLNPDGGIYIDNLRSAHQTDTFVLAGLSGTGGDEVYEPRFTFHGFRYVEVSGYPGELTAGDLTGVVIGSDLPPAGDFVCSDDLVNRIQHAIVWGLRGNFVSIPTDCPQRDERLGWLADAQIFARTATANAGVAAFFTRWLEDVADAQSAEGAFPDVAPRLIDMADGAPAWGDGGVIVPWVVHTAYGDTRVIQERLAGMAAWVDYLHDANPNLLWQNKRNNDFGDWLSVGADTSKELLATAYFAYSTDLLARMAEVAGETEMAARYRALRADIGDAFARAYIGDDGRIAGSPNPWRNNPSPGETEQAAGPDGNVETQTGYVLALHMNLVPEGLRAAALARLVADIETRGVLTTGFTGVGYILPLLTAEGQTDLAYRLLRSERFPSWGYMIHNGATTIWERWDGWTEERGFQDPNMNSFNHYSLGSVGEWLYRSVAGIDLDPERPGFAHVVVRPQPGGGLTWARATYAGVRGEIASGWELDGGTLTLRVTIPPGSTATIAVPTSDPDAVMEGDGPAASAAGLSPSSREQGAAVFVAGAGSYTFQAPLSG